MRAARPVAAVLAAFLFLAPLVLMVTGSLRKVGLPPPRGPELLPSPPAFDNDARAFELVDLGGHAANSLLVAAIAVPLSVLVASRSARSGRRRRRGRRIRRARAGR